MTYNCPKCGTGETASFEMVYAAGTKSWSASGMLVGGSDDLHLGYSEGQSSTRLADSIAPPTQRSIVGARIATLVGGIGLVIFGITGIAVLAGGSRNDRDTGVGALAMALGCAIALSVGWSRWSQAAGYNKREWPLHYKKWRQWWLCRRCGHRFVPEK